MEPDLTFFDNKTILITGGGGYLGAKLAKKLSDRNVKISILDVNFNSISIELIKSNKNCTKYEIDLNNFEQLQEACKIIKPVLIFHFAAKLNRERDFSIYDELYNVNVKGTLNLLNSLKDIDYENFIYSSSSEIYGNQTKNVFDENLLPLPASPYSLTKLMSEELIKTYSTINKKPHTILRLFNFYGDDMPANFFISQLYKNLNNNEVFEMTAGEQVRDFLEINDLIKYIIKITTIQESIGETINICSGKGEKIKNIAIKIAHALKKEHLLHIGALPYRNNEVWEMIGNKKKFDTLIIS